MRRKFSISYDRKIDDLFIYLSRKKSSASVEFGDVVLDIDADGKVVGVEVQGASRLLSKISGVKVSKSDLEKISQAVVEVSKIQNSLIVKIFLKIKPEKEIVSPIVVPC